MIKIENQQKKTCLSIFAYLGVQKAFRALVKGAWYG